MLQWIRVLLPHLLQSALVFPTPGCLSQEVSYPNSSLMPLVLVSLPFLPQAILTSSWLLGPPPSRLPVFNSSWSQFPTLGSLSSLSCPFHSSYISQFLCPAGCIPLCPPTPWALDASISFLFSLLQSSCLAFPSSVI